jgi:hypothetical protein
MEHLFLWELCEGNLEGGLLCWGPIKVCKESSGNGTSFSMHGLRKGNLQGGFLYWGL